MSINNEPNSPAEIADLRKKADNTFRIAKISKAKFKDAVYPGPETRNWSNVNENGDWRGPRYQFKFGENAMSYWLPLAPPKAGASGTSYTFHEPDEQILVLAEDGDREKAIGIAAQYQTSALPPVTWDQPTKDGRAWDSHISQFQFKDTSYLEYRDHTCPVVKNDGRLLFAGLKSSDQLFEYHVHPEKRKLHIHIKEMDIKLDGDYQLLIDKDGLIKVQNLTIEVEETLTIKAANINIEAKENIKVSAGINTEILSVGVNKFTNIAGPKHGHS